eukprot:90508-Alexandrium_andersonii.AAC.1
MAPESSGPSRGVSDLGGRIGATAAGAVELPPRCRPVEPLMVGRQPPVVPEERGGGGFGFGPLLLPCLLYTSPSPRD